MALKPTDIVTIELTVDEFGSLLAALRRAEEISAVARANELDFRMQRMRFERKFRDSVPPPPDGEDTRMADLRDLVDLYSAPTRRPPPRG